MSNIITRLGIDPAKNIFQVCAVNAHGKVLFNKKVKRANLPSMIANTPSCEVVLESCSSSHDWAGVFEQSGHTVKLINPAYVRPYVKTNKPDSLTSQPLHQCISPVQRLNRASPHQYEYK